MGHHYGYTAVTQLRHSGFVAGIGGAIQAEERTEGMNVDIGLGFNAVSQNRPFPPLSLVA